MADLDIEPSGTWDWAFIWPWDAHFLREHIKTVKATYNRNDPHTWPLIEKVSLSENGPDLRKHEPLPGFLAYEQSLMEDIVKYRPMGRTEDYCVTGPRTQKIHKGFRDYPFNFNRKGLLRGHPHIPVSEFREWASLVAGMRSDTSVTSLASEMVDEQRPTNDLLNTVSPISTYEQIMKALVNAKTGFPAIVADLEEQLNRATEQCRKEKLRVDKADCTIGNFEKEKKKQADEWRRKVREVQEELEQYKAYRRSIMAEEKQRRDTIQELLKTCEKRLEEKNDELGAAEQEVVEANQRIVTVWTEMQKLQGTNTRKRKVANEASAPQQKTTKLDMEVESLLDTTQPSIPSS
ncbi:hypothetical protein BKA66DRAFT_570355 [Pyrenochaeta sp. MPI-SDFR-AT-0127]|nr:hypothetical protein BKA66DRAFT_570355 [Pyrenochaeta sp. MPI-SDFR-AT-0127]